MTSICRFILKILNWKVSGYEPLYDLKKFVVIVAPHTSNWDFVVGIIVRTAFKLEKIKYLGKSSLFRPPFGWIFRALGGYPVYRERSHNLVESYVKIFDEHDAFAIVISPEGTRHKVKQFKTGYYYIAKGAHIPIIPVKFNFADKHIEFCPAYYCTQNTAEDLATIENMFRGVKGKNPQFGLWE